MVDIDTSKRAAHLYSTFENKLSLNVYGNLKNISLDCFEIYRTIGKY